MPRVGRACNRVGPVFLRHQQWIEGIRTSRKDVLIPFVEKTGHISAQPMAVSSMTPQTLFASLVGTVFKKTKTRLHKCCPKGRVPNNDLILRIAVMYVATNNRYTFDRLIEMSKRTQSIGRVLYAMQKKLDDKTRFLIDQTRSRALWFQLRAARPRVKSMHVSPHCGVPLGVLRNGLKIKMNEWLDGYLPPRRSFGHH